MYDITQRELDLGLLGLAEFAPAFVLVLLVGSVADRYDRRKVVAAGAAGEAVVALGLAWYATTDPTSVAPIFALVLAFGVARAFVAPAARALPADIVTPERLPWLVARESAVWQAAIVAGPVLAGFLYAVDAALPYVGMAVLAVVGAVAMAFVTTTRHRDTVTVGADSLDEVAVVVQPTDEEQPSFGAALEGLRFIRRTPVLLGAVSLDLFAVLFGGAVALLPAVAEERLGVGAVGFGWLRAAGGIGAAVVTVILALRPVRRHVGRTLLVAVAAFGVFTILLGTTREYAVAFVAMAVLSGADAVSVFIRATLLPLVTPPDKRGRVLAVENVFIGGSNELGAFESGVAGQVLGPAGAIVLGGVATIAIAGTWAVAFPQLRDIDRFPGDDGAS